jgi:signal transduction histidine kinase
MQAGTEPLSEALLALHGSLSRSKILLAALQNALHGFHAELAAVLTLLPHAHELEVAWLRAPQAKRLQRFRLARNHGVEWWLFSANKPLIGPGALMRLAASPALGDRAPLFQPAQIRSFMACPLKTGARSKGTLVVVNPGGGQPFDARDLDRLRLLARHAALALDNAAAHETLHALNQELGRQVKATTHQLLSANQYLRGADVAKTELISMVSHELRTPITAIAGFTKLLSKSSPQALSAEQSQFLEIILKHAESLEHMITDLLDITKIEQGRLEMRPSRLSLNALANEAVLSLQAFLPGQEKRIRVAPAEESSVLCADRIRLLQVVNNLLTNALKYSPLNTPVTLKVWVRAQRIGLEVENEGEALTAEQLERVFEKFFRIRTSATQNIPGSGLGLAVSKMILQAHGGRIWAENRAEGKVAFCFELPSPPEAPAGTPPPVNAAAAR